MGLGPCSAPLPCLMGSSQLPQHWAPSRPCLPRWVSASVSPHLDPHCCHPETCDPKDQIACHGSCEKEKEPVASPARCSLLSWGRGMRQSWRSLVGQMSVLLCCWLVDWEAGNVARGRASRQRTGVHERRPGQLGLCSIPAALWVGTPVDAGLWVYTGPPDLTAATARCLLPSPAGFILSSVGSLMPSVFSVSQVQTFNWGFGGQSDSSVSRLCYWGGIVVLGRL